MVLKEGNMKSEVPEKVVLEEGNKKGEGVRRRWF